MKKLRQITIGIIAGCVALLMFSACDNTIDGFDEEGGVETFSLFGFLDLKSEINFIRIKDLNAPIVSGQNATIDAEVTLLNVDTGATESLVDSVVVFQGIATHNFRTNMDITPETTYRLLIENSSGDTRIAEAITPELADVTIQPESDFTCRNVIRIIIDPVKSNELIQASLRFVVQGEIFEVDPDIQQTGTTARIVFQPSEVVNRKSGGQLDCENDQVSRFDLEYTHIGPGYEEILDDFGNLGTEQFVGLYKDTVTFSINHEL